MVNLQHISCNALYQCHIITATKALSVAFGLYFTFLELISMISITEKKIGKESVFIVKDFAGDDNPNNFISEHTVRVRTFTPQYKGTERYLIYDSDMNVISDAYRYLNHNLKQLATNTTSKSMYALKYLYVFLEVFGKTVQQLDQDDIVKLTYFLTGVTSNGQNIQLDLLTNRGKVTVNSFFSIYRDYFRFLRIAESPIFNENSYSKYVPNKPKTQIQQSIKNFKGTTKYISNSDFENIVHYIRKNSVNREIAMRNECLVRVMFEGGLRLGEALGSTIEDYILEEIDGRYICFVYIRNRVSNLPYQNAKTCMNVWDKKNYTSFEYQTQNIGYQLTYLSSDTYDLLMDYIDFSQARADKICNIAYESKAKADAVAACKESNQDNYYVFINSKCTPLSSSSWNKILRNIFENVGLTVDYGVKRNNLSHRFRHGFVMNLLHEQKLSAEKVIERTRHKSITSLAAYYTPTTEDTVKIKIQIEDKIKE